MEFAKAKNSVKYILSFVLPASILLVCMLLNNIYPFKDGQTFLVGDMYGQYVKFFDFYVDNFFSFDLFSFNKGLGGETIGILCYYLLSPLNLLLLPFKDNVLVGLYFLSIIKIGLIGLTSFIFFNKKTDGRSVFSLAIALCFSLSSYSVVYLSNIMWIDGVILLPLILLGIDKIVLENKKSVSYVIFLSLAIISNYYIGFMLCVFSVLYFIYGMVITHSKNDKEIIRNKIVRFIFLSLFVGGISSGVLILVALSLKDSSAITNSLVSSGIIKYSFVDIYSSFFNSTFYREDLLLGFPKLFIGIIPLVLSVYYFLSGEKKKNKIASFCLLAFMLLCVEIKYLDLVWHAFKLPNGFNCRYAFLVAFTLCIVATDGYNALVDAKEKKITKEFFKEKKNIFLSLLVGVVIIATIAILYLRGISKFKLLLNILLIFSAVSVAFVYNKTSRKKLLVCLLAGICFFDMTLNAYTIEKSLSNMAVSVKNYKSALSYDELVIDKINSLDDGIFYRNEFVLGQENNSLELEYNGLSHFSSGDSNALRKLLNNLGYNVLYSTSFKSGSTMLSNSLLSIKYVASKKEFLGNGFYNKIDESGEYGIYKNDYALNLGFVASSNIATFEFDDNPFISQNNLINHLTGIDAEIYKNAIKEVKENTFTSNQTFTINDSFSQVDLLVESDGVNPTYIYLSNGGKREDYVVIQSGEKIENYLVDKGGIVNLGVLPLGENTLTIKPNSKSVKLDGYYVYSENTQELKTLLQNLKSNEMTLTLFSNDKIKGSINSPIDGMVVTSIPYNKNFRVKVDGKVVKPQKVLDGLLGFNISSGEYKVTITYENKLPILATCLSGVGVVSFVVYINYEKIRKKGKKEEK